jgi:murein L,D-transpeptidase YcbB/YkuD
VKFLFPNKYDVYLHNTPLKHLFAEQDRTFSSGCIRLEKAMDLAEYVLRGNKGWTREKILAAATGKRRELTLALPEPIPVHLTYFTAWMEADGTVHFRKDFYRRDRRLAKALDKRPPRSAVVQSSDSSPS